MASSFFPFSSCLLSYLFSGPCFVLAYLLYDITRSETSLLLCLPRFALKCVLNLNYSLFLTLMISPLPLPALRREHAWIWVLGSRLERCFMNVWVFKPLAPSNSSSSLSSMFKKHENIKCHVFGHCIWGVEHASFTPIILSATGGFAHEVVFSKNAWLAFYPPSGCWVFCGSWLASLLPLFLASALCNPVYSWCTFIYVLGSSVGLNCQWISWERSPVYLSCWSLVSFVALCSGVQHIPFVLEVVGKGSSSSLGKK